MTNLLGFYPIDVLLATMYDQQIPGNLLLIGPPGRGKATWCAQTAEQASPGSAVVVPSCTVPAIDQLRDQVVSAWARTIAVDLSSGSDAGRSALVSLVGSMSGPHRFLLSGSLEHIPARLMGLCITHHVSRLADDQVRLVCTQMGLSDMQAQFVLPMAQGLPGRIPWLLHLTGKRTNLMHAIDAIRDDDSRALGDCCRSMGPDDLALLQILSDEYTSERWHMWTPEQAEVLAGALPWLENLSHPFEITPALYAAFHQFHGRL